MSKQDITFSVVSPRQRVALEILDTIRCCDLDQVYGGSIERSVDEKGKGCWVLTFCRARTVDGIVRVYGDHFIQVKYTRGSRKVSEIFRTAYDAKAYLVNTFVQHF